MNKKATVEDIRKTYTSEKAESEYLNYHWLYIAMRPLSFYLTPFFVNRGIHANTVTLLGIIPIIFAIAGNIVGGYSTFGFVLGGFFANLWLLFDVIDGNIARYHNSGNNIGGLLDAFIGSLVKVFLPLSVAVGLFIAGSDYGIIHHYWTFSPELYVIVAAVWVLAVLIRQNLSLLWLHFIRPQNNHHSKSIINRFAQGLSSYEIPALFLFALFGRVDLWFLFYALFNVLTPVGTIFLNFYRFNKDQKV